MPRLRILAVVAALALSACGKGAADPFVGFGPDPKLPAPDHNLVPTLNAAKAVGWPKGAGPRAPEGFVVTRFAGPLIHPRWLYVLPNGDVLVAESSTEPVDPKTITDRVANSLQRRGGSLMQSPNRILLLRDADGDGVAETQSVYATNLKRPSGMALVGDKLFVAEDDALVRLTWTPGLTQAPAPPVKVADLPGGPINHHWVKNVIASPDGTKLYVAVGSNSNIAENGMENETERADVLEMNLDGSGRRVFASGLRNPNGLAWQPVTGVLWAAVNERDMLGDDLVPDYMTGLKDGAFYGWPYSYFGQHVDDRVKPQRPDLVAKAIKPDYALGPHTASLGLAFYTANAFPARYHGGAFVAQHGSWNREPLNGYRVVFIPFANGEPSGQPQVFLSGFLNAKDEAQGRPVDVAVDSRGGLLVTDDAGKMVWRVAPAGS
ncbi:sorbosone dehydrogenase family protein [Phenylobacterium sp.]|uniref:PQQ-dependent sugar dehydrogenase n=1 Tax=Phenylobacterium sp. TaxID=1871053 RepID=UPI0035AF88FE